MKRCPKHILARFKGKHIVVAWASYEAGPGWANTPVWVILRGEDGSLEQECLQPEEQSKEIRVLFGSNAASSGYMTKQVKEWVER